MMMQKFPTINTPNNQKLLIVIGVGVAGIVILSAAQRIHRNRKRDKGKEREDFGAFVKRFELAPFPQPPPPAAPLPLSGLKFAVKDIFEVKGEVTGFGNPDWARTNEESKEMATAIISLLKSGATCVGSTVLDELSLGVSGENVLYGTPVNPLMPSHSPGGSSSGSAVAVAAELVDFSLGTDSIGGVRIPAAHCGVFGYRPSHGAVPVAGVFPNSQSLDTVGWFARDPSMLHRVGHVLLQLKIKEPRRTRRILFAEDLFELFKLPKQRMALVLGKVVESLKGYQYPEQINLGDYIASNVPSLKGFNEQSTKLKSGTKALKALSAVTILLQRCEFKTNHEKWVRSFKPKFGPDAAYHVHAAVDTDFEDVKTLYQVRSEMRTAVKNLLKDDGLLVLPTIADSALERNLKKRLSSELFDRAVLLSCISSMSGCCQAVVPLGMQDGYPSSISFAARHGADKFLLDTILDVYSSLKEQASLAPDSLPLNDTNGYSDSPDELKEQGNEACKGKQWNKAIGYYTKAIKLNETNATLYSNRAQAYLKLGWFQQAEEDCNKAISLDKKNVKAYLRRGTARESLLWYKEAAQDFNHALVLEPQNTQAKLAVKRLMKLMT